eukprot:gene23371-29584_t
MYAAADYRYGIYEGGQMESGTVAMEAITALIVVGANAPWAVFPTILLVQSFIASCASFNKTKVN